MAKVVANPARLVPLDQVIRLVVFKLVVISFSPILLAIPSYLVRIHFAFLVTFLLGELVALICAVNVFFVTLP